MAETVAVPVSETFLPTSPGQPPASLGGLRSVPSKLRGLKQGPVVGLIVIAAVVIAVVGANLTSGGPYASSNSSPNSSTTDTSVGGSSNDAWMQQCIKRRLANGNPQVLAQWGDGGRSTAETMCSYGTDYKSVTAPGFGVEANE